MTEQQRENERLVGAARHAALTLPKDHPGRAAIFTLAQEFLSLAREHSLCLIRPTVSSLAEQPASCACTHDRVAGTNLCHTHARDRDEYLGRKMDRLRLEAADLKPEKDAIVHALQIHRATITKVPPAETKATGTKKPLDPRLNDLLKKLESLK
jgi:hypothetical protein